jgi:predicted GIY-YIG superfamily endonuclease
MVQRNSDLVWESFFRMDRDVESAWVYILLCADGSYYVGSARGALADRLAKHDSGVHDGYTKARRPIRLVWSQSFQYITDAIAAERQVKGWRREKKEALINGKLDLLPKLSKTARTQHNTQGRTA